MDFDRVLDLVAGFLERAGFRYAVVGAFALHAHGLSRGTLDLDFVTQADAQDHLVAFLESLGYETLHRSVGYSNHVHPMAALGRVDIIYVDGATSARLFAGCRTMSTGTGRDVPVPRPEHIAAMKVQAMKNDPARTLHDLADIRFLLDLPGVDAREIQGYFERAGLRDRYDDLRRLS